MALWRALFGGCLVMAASLLVGCETRAVISPEVSSLPEQVELSGVPFFAEPAFSGAPGALAILLMHQGVVTTPGLVAKQMRLPKADGALEQGITRVANESGLMVYPLRASLDESLTQVAAGFPVLVRFQGGVGWVSSTHYSVIVGYDRRAQRLILRDGSERRRLMDFADFQEAWQAEGSWAVLLQSPKILPSRVDSRRWQAAADALARVGQPVAAKQAVDALLRAGK